MMFSFSSSANIYRGHEDGIATQRIPMHGSVNPGLFKTQTRRQDNTIQGKTRHKSSQRTTRQYTKQHDRDTGERAPRVNTQHLQYTTNKSKRQHNAPVNTRTAHKCVILHVTTRQSEKHKTRCATRSRHKLNQHKHKLTEDTEHDAPHESTRETTCTT